MKRAAGADPGSELTALLQDLRDRLTGLTSDCDPLSHDSTACLEELRHYLLGELVPVLQGLRLRVHPALQRAVGREWGRAGMVEQARLSRLTDLVVAIQADIAIHADIQTDLAAGTSRHGRTTRAAQLTQLTHDLAQLADAHLTREQETLPFLLRELPDEQAGLLLEAAARTAAAVRTAPRTDLNAAFL